MMEADLRTLLVSDSVLKGMLPSGNVRINFVPQGVSGVAVAIYRITGAPGYTMHGADRLEESRFQIDVRGSDPKNAPGAGYTAAYRVADRIKSLLSGFRGVVGGTQFQMVALLSERQSSEKPDTELFHRFSMDFEIWSRAAS